MYKPRIRLYNGKWSTPWFPWLSYIHLTLEERKALDKARRFAHDRNRKEGRTHVPKKSQATTA